MLPTIGTTSTMEHVPVASLSELLEEQSNRRSSNLPGIEPSQKFDTEGMSPQIPSPTDFEFSPSNAGLEGLLPLLLQKNLRGGGGPGKSGGPVGNVEGLARRWAMNRYGYSPSDWNKLDYIISNESNWNPHALNPSSGAAGIAQNIQGFSQGYSENDPREQLRWLFNYIENHHGGIDAAYSHKKATGWY